MTNPIMDLDKSVEENKSPLKRKKTFLKKKANSKITRSDHEEIYPIESKPS